MNSEDKKLINDYLDKISKVGFKGKDLILAYHQLILEKITDALEKISATESKKELKKEVKEIENTISLGIPGWIKYIRKTKKEKK